MRGEIDRGRVLNTEARDTYRAAGMAVSAASLALHASWIEERSGDLDAWERVVRSAVAELESLNERQYYSTVAARLAQCLYLQNRLDEASALCVVVRDQSAREDLVNFIYADALEAAVLAQRDRREEAAAQMSRAVEAAETTDFVFIRAQIGLLSAEVHASCRSRCGG